MYPRLKRVRRGDQVHEYVQLVEGRREAGKVRQRVVATLGRLDELKASGSLIGGPARSLGSTRLRPACTARSARCSSSPTTCAGSGWSGWPTRPRRCSAGAYAVAELLGVPAGLLNDDRLGRALDALAPVVEDVRARTLLATLERF